MPRGSVASGSTVRTVDDVMSQMDQCIGINASLKESRDFIKSVTKGNRALASDAIDEIENVESILSPITSNPRRLVQLMMRHDAIIVGPQATSFFYPICDFDGCPWDMFCHVKESDRFVDGYKSSSGADAIEDVCTKDGIRVVHMRRSLSGSTNPCKIRIFISPKHPVESVLEMKNTYEQSFISCVGAVCLWPRLQSHRLYRTFCANPGIKDYPRGSTYYESSIRIGKKTSLKKPMETPSVYVGLDKRADSLIFKNTCGLDREQYYKKVGELQSIVYCAFNNSTRYLGTIGNMS